MKHEKLIEHLSNEIEVLSNNLMMFRTRIAFTIYIGPFLVLGTVIVASKGNFTLSLSNLEGLLFAIAVSVGCYVGLGVAAGRIEKQGWKQCNKWRKAIVALSSEDSDVKIFLDHFLFSSIEKRIQQGYLAVFVLIITSALSIGYVASQVKATPNKAEGVQVVPDDPKTATCFSVG